MGAAGLALEPVGGTGLDDGEDLKAADLPAIALAAVVFFTANSTLARTAEALLQNHSIADHLKADLVFRAWSAGTLFALGPPVAVIASTGSTSSRCSRSRWPRCISRSTQASEMEHLALHDPLTALPNRALLLQATTRALRTPQRRRRRRPPCSWSTSTASAT